MKAPLTVVFVHGYTLSMASWTFQRRTLAAELATANGHRPDARLVFYDQRGHGSSGRGTAENSTIEQLARDLSAVLEARVPRGPVVLVGHSMGGMTIMGLAAMRPELFGSKVVGVALISTSSGNLADLRFGLPELLTRVRAAVFPVAAWTMRRRPAFAERTRRMAADVVSAATRSLSFASGDVDPALVHYVDAMIAGTPVDVIAEFYPALAGLDHTGSLTPLRDVPTLVLTGDKDKMIPKEHSELIVERLPDAEFVVVPDAGHMVLLEKPDEVTAALSRAAAPGRRRGGPAGRARRLISADLQWVPSGGTGSARTARTKSFGERWMRAGVRWTSRLVLRRGLRRVRAAAAAGEGRAPSRVTKISARWVVRRASPPGRAAPRPWRRCRAATSSGGGSPDSRCRTRRPAMVGPCRPAAGQVRQMPAEQPVAVQPVGDVRAAARRRPPASGSCRCCGARRGRRRPGPPPRPGAGGRGRPSRAARGGRPAPGRTARGRRARRRPSGPARRRGRRSRRRRGHGSAPDAAMAARPSCVEPTAVHRQRSHRRPARRKTHR